MRTSPAATTMTRRPSRTSDILQPQFALRRLFQVLLHLRRRCVAQSSVIIGTRKAYNSVDSVDSL